MTASAAFLHALDAGALDPDLPSAAERLHYGGYHRRREGSAAIDAMAAAGAANNAITKRTGGSRQPMQAVLRQLAANYLLAKSFSTVRHNAMRIPDSNLSNPPSG
jgi:hypothetical protein